MAVANSLMYFAKSSFPALRPAAATDKEAQIRMINRLAATEFMNTVGKEGEMKLKRGADAAILDAAVALLSAAFRLAFAVSPAILPILAIKPTPETSRALEAEAREQILRGADEAVYARRNAAVEQERAIKENELNTEIAVDNDLFVGPRSHTSARYSIRIGGRSELHSSSGIIVSTGLGSHMAENGVIFSDGIESDFLQFNSGTQATIALAKKQGHLVT